MAELGPDALALISNGLALGLRGVPIGPYGRGCRHVDLSPTSRREADQFNRFGDLISSASRFRQDPTV